MSNLGIVDGRFVSTSLYLEDKLFKFQLWVCELFKIRTNYMLWSSHFFSLEVSTDEYHICLAIK